ncbi:MAG: type VI secretion system baseplate subunit TssF [Edaphobacter sp.]
MDDRIESIAAFRDELNYLREAGQSFANRHPKLAERLELSREGSADPHVERLIESFAFLTSRIQRRLDSEFPEFTSALLGLLYPNLVNPIPPMTLARIVADPARGKLTSGYTIPRHTRLFAQTTNDLTCRFQTAYPVTLWPLEVVEAEFTNKARFDFLDCDTRVASVLRLRLESRGAAFSDLEVKQLRFHLNGNSHLTGRLYELLFHNCIGITLHDRVTGRAVSVPISNIRAVGFEPDEEVIPYPLQSHPAYRLLQEYFWLPEKFLFFDLLELDRNPSIIDLDILFLFDIAPRERLPITRETFALGCTPIVNLFPRTSEPIRIDHTKTEYRLVPDARREHTTEVHSILSVSSSSNPAEESRQLHPLYGTSGADGLQQRAFWYARRVLSERTDLLGTDVFLSFVDLAFNPSQPPAETAFAHLLCTNRNLASQLQENALLQTEDPGPISHIHCLRKPTAAGYPPLGGASRWALISNLSLNHLSLSNDGASLETLKKILSLYSLSNSPAVQQQINSLRKMTVRKVTRRMGGNGWQDFRQGSRVHLDISRENSGGGTTFLFLAVLEKFLGLHAPLNSFVHIDRTTGDGRN